MFVSLTTIAIYLRAKNRESRLVFWSAWIIFFGGLTGLQVILEKEVLPSLTYYEGYQVLSIIKVMTGLLNFIVNTSLYYCILIFFCIYNGYLQHIKWQITVLSLPLWITFFFYTDLPTNELNEVFIATWGICYVLTAGVLAVRPIALEKNPAQRMYHMAIALIFLFPLMSLNAFQFMPSPYSDQFLVLFPMLSVICMLIIILLYLRGNFLGVKRKSVKTVHLGTSIILHSLKNSAGKIKLNALNIRKGINAQSLADMEEYVDNLLKIHDTMMSSMAQISQTVNDQLVIHKEEVELSTILDEMIETMKVYPDLRVKKKYSPLQVSVDRKLFSESLFNICNNAIEAMMGVGEICIHLECKKKSAILSIRDNGPGMSHLQLQNIYEPFYTTKQRSGKNFGLGMYHVKKVIEAHKGRVEIKSKPGEGTTVKLVMKR